MRAKALTTTITMRFIIRVSPGRGLGLLLPLRGETITQS
jgi:hypothetical protein